MNVRVARVRRVPQVSHFIFSLLLDLHAKLLYATEPKQINSYEMKMMFLHHSSISKRESWSESNSFSGMVAEIARSSWMKVVSNSKLIYLLINNELAERVDVDWEFDPNIARRNRERKKIINNIEEQDLHVLCFFMLKICESITENKYWIGVYQVIRL